MSALAQKRKKAYCHPALRGLTDKELVSFYNTTSIKKIGPGEAVVDQADKDDCIYLILEGTAQIHRPVNRLNQPVARLRQGDAVLGAFFSENGTSMATVAALEPLRVLVLDQNSFNALSAKVQATIFKNLLGRFQQSLLNIAVGQKALSEKHRALASSVLELLEAKSIQYSNSEMIQGMLKNIPRLPMYANRLAVVILDENVSTRDVAELAKLDPSLVSIVLKTVNSAYYGFKRKISDFQHAVLLLGFNQIYQLVMDVGIRSTMPKTPEFRELLFHSMVVSFIGFEISQLTSVRKAVSISTIGLLHDIGQSVILLLKGKHPKMGLLVDMLDQAKLGALLLKQWNIPDEVCQTLEYQDYPKWLPPEYIPEKHRKNLAILYLAHLCYEYLRGKSENDLPSPFLGDYLGLLDRQESSIAEFVDRIILPSLRKKMKTFPEEVRAFLTKGDEDMAAGEKANAPQE